jgi:cytidylate kinase
MAVIAMTREMGSGGGEVAQRAAEEMGLALALHEVVERDLAHRLEVPQTVIHRRFEGGAGLLERWQVGDRRLAHHAAEEIISLAECGNVLIRGWGACALLRDVPHAVRVRVCAPVELRVERVMARRRFDHRAAARREIERNDAAHRHTLRAAFGVEREDPLLYDLVLNTGRVSIETCARLVRQLTESPEFRVTEASQTILADKALEARIHARLGERFTAATGVSNLKAHARAGRVILDGIAIHPDLAAEAGALAGDISGVTHVANRIEVVRGPRGL